MELISIQRIRGVAVIAGLLLAAVPQAGVPAGRAPDAEQALQRVQRWVRGRYDNRLQAERDLADPAIPDDLKHRLMHQLFVPVTVPVPAIPGYLVYQQSSVDGSDDPSMITRAGLLQFFIDGSGRLHQRELNFRDLDAFKNAHRDPERLRTLTLEQVRLDPGCDFLLALAEGGGEVAGPMQAGACRFFSQGLNKQLTADDAVTIRADEYWFLGRFVDAEGRVMWGNASSEPVMLHRQTME
jgi:hypothetical protein